jgi:hypothetical protein
VSAGNVSTPDAGELAERLERLRERLAEFRGRL